MQNRQHRYGSSFGRASEKRPCGCQIGKKRCAEADTHPHQMNENERLGQKMKRHRIRRHRNAERRADLRFEFENLSLQFGHGYARSPSTVLGSTEQYRYSWNHRRWFCAGGISVLQGSDDAHVIVDEIGDAAPLGGGRKGSRVVCRRGCGLCIADKVKRCHLHEVGIIAIVR